MTTVYSGRDLLRSETPLLRERSVSRLSGSTDWPSKIADASTHTLRKTFAAHHVRKDTKVDVLRQTLGHESLATTSIYAGLAREVMDQELQRNAL